MGAGLTRPDVWFGLSMARDPNDGATLPYWQDWSASLRKVSEYERGRNFELDLPLASEPSLLIRDVDELLNADNTASPYYGLVQPYRETCLRAQWPVTASGGNNNLFNTAAWRGNKVDAYDPTFESFATGTRPNWVGPVGPVSPQVVALFPFQGAQSMKWDTAASTTWQGADWPVACIPGRQYTTSVYVLQNVASTQRISVVDQLFVADPFAGRTVVAGIGTAYSGGSWTAAGGAAGDYAVNAGTAQITNASATVNREISINAGTPDQTVFARFVIPMVPTGGAVTQWVGARRTDIDNQYIVAVGVATDSTVTLTLAKRVAGVQTTIATTTLGYHQAGAMWNVQLVCSGPFQFVYAWKEGKPPASQAAPATLTGTDTAITSGNTCGYNSRRETGNTDAFVAYVHDFYASGYVHGTTTTSTAGYVRLSVTFTATQPEHRVQLATSGSALAGSVHIDAIQHEQAAAASTFSATGPVIYPILRNLAEQWSRTWDANGFEGFTDPPCVDALAALNTIKISQEVTQAILNTGPDYYYRLNDGADTGLFADTSGNGRPALSRYVSKYGAGTDIEPGTATELAGDAGGTGVKFTGVSGVGTSPGTALGSTSIRLPEVISSAGDWALSFSCWASTVPTGPSSVQALICASTGPGVGKITGPILLELDSSGFQSITLYLFGPITSATHTFSPALPIFDGIPHHYACSIAVVGANATLTIWVDGVAFSSVYAIGGWPAGTGKTPLVTLGLDTAGLSGFGWNGIIGHATIWNRAITDAEVQTMYGAGSVGYNGETSGARQLRHIVDSAGYTGATRISQQATGGFQTPMQPPSWTGTKDVGTDAVETSVAEQGNVWVAPDGAVTIEDRQDRWLRLTPQWVIGENDAGGEIPYLGAGLRFTPDPLYVFASVQVDRANGASTVGGTLADIATTKRRYFNRSYQARGDFYTDDLAQSLSNYVFNTHNAPVTRVATLTIDPTANPALWPFVLGAEVGQRTTVKRRAKAANSGAGFTFSQDFFIEKITIEEIDFDTNNWLYHFELSPINAAATPPAPSMQPWILNNTTYSVLNSTTRLGW